MLEYCYLYICIVLYVISAVNNLVQRREPFVTIERKWDGIQAKRKIPFRRTNAGRGVVLCQDVPLVLVSRRNVGNVIPYMPNTKKTKRDLLFSTENYDYLRAEILRGVYLKRIHLYKSCSVLVESVVVS